MYYGIDENGKIIQSQSSDILDPVYQALYPFDASDTVSSGDANVISSSSNSSGIPYEDFLTYDDMVSILSNEPTYSLYPNASAVSVFTDVLNGIDGNVEYFIYSGSDSNTAFLAYGDHVEVSGSSWTLSGDVFLVSYYRYRLNTSSPYEYCYTVNSVGDITIDVTNKLVYTNAVDGYPDVIQYKSHESFFILFSIPLFILLSSFLSAYLVRRNHV